MNKKRILVVDDEKECCDFFKEYLASRNCEIDIAYDGLNAKYLLEYKIYDVIFFDCNMPELSGVELIKIIRKKNPRAKAIMISGYDCIDEGFAKTINIEHFIQKPISLEAVKKAIDET